MSEQELAEKFNRELDSLLAGEAPAAPCDPGAMAIASALSDADFSGGSRIREELRGRLAPEAGGILSGLAALLSNNYARAALVAACLAVVLLPLARRSPVPVTVPVPAPVAQTPAAPGPEITASSEALSPVPRAELWLKQPPKPDAGLFASVPMGMLEGEKISQFPIAAAGRGAPIAVSGVRAVSDENGSGVAWETETTVFELRRQPIALEDLFQVISI
ncbi:MAG: hypothetical protein M0011_01915 [Elusimicrobia bacterium]|nr:hypothetical protein [Elusimicrobiota bacterium]